MNYTQLVLAGFQFLIGNIKRIDDFKKKEKPSFEFQFLIGNIKREWL